ncbi:hypothetical protein RS3R6_00160 [Pseudomonas atacamensis]|uniref:Transcriptional regulator n=1 Tax=Pseudomonas atacamensis TaxID=2565368 RepID=A0ABQ5PE90_9PSED|nr:hypothetical protein RS3R1_07570 [Pseudomonas atacamensis]GLH51835.1 hypothetical protein RS3R6_00160 [Pseudomonas atacamensis]
MKGDAIKRMLCPTSRISDAAVLPDVDERVVDRLRALLAALRTD